MIAAKYKIALPHPQEKLIRSGWGEDIPETTEVSTLKYNIGKREGIAYIARPLHRGVFPCILWLRGGYGKRGFIDEFTARGMLGKFASHGYVVLAPMYGSADANGSDELGGAELDDIFGLIDLMRTFEFADSSRWGIEGWSRGGYMAYHILRKSKSFSAAVIASAISDMPAFVGNNEGFRVFCNDELGISGEELQRRSPLNFTGELPVNTHYLLIHGTRDEVVPPSQTIAMAASFLERDMDFRMVMLEKGDHYLKKHRDEINRLRSEWFRLYLTG